MADRELMVATCDAILSAYSLSAGPRSTPADRPEES